MRVRAECRWLGCVLLGLMLPLSGCLSGGGATRRNASIKSAKSVKSSAAELSARNQSLLALYSSEVEAAADKVILESPSAVARRQALEWKADAIPVMQASLLNIDPVSAVFDTWVFLFQMSAYMDRAAVKQGFGEFHSVVADTLKNMDAEMEQLVRVAAPSANVADLRQKALAFAEAHPVQSGLAGRRSADPELIKRVGEADLGAMASLQSLSESLGDITARLDSYNVYAPKQARWQAELLVRDLSRDPQVESAKASLVGLSNSLAKTSGSIERMPELIGQTREAVRADVDGQRLATQAFLRQERLETLDALTQERIATIAAVHNERIAAQEDLRGERRVVLDAVHQEADTAMQGFNAATEKAIQELDSSSRKLIDHFFWRALQLVLLTLALCFLVAWILLRRFALRPPDRGERLYDRAA